MSTIYHTKYKLLKYKLFSKEITNISTRVTCPTEEVSSYILLTWDVFHSKGVFLYRYRPPETLGRSGTTLPLGTSRTCGLSGA